jgi:hypothetical protein
MQLPGLAQFSAVTTEVRDPKAFYRTKGGIIEEFFIPDVQH